jgi:hypothetical protein
VENINYQRELNHKLTEHFQPALVCNNQQLKSKKEVNAKRNFHNCYKLLTGF